MSGFYIGVDGRAQKVKGGYIGIDGKARKLKKGYIGDENGVARLCWTAFDGDPVFANNTWEKIAEACQTGNVPSTWNIGDTKTLSDQWNEYTISIVGKNHDEYSDGSGKAPLTFQFLYLHSQQKYINNPGDNSTGWADSWLRNEEMPTLLASFPEIANLVRPVNKLSDNGSGEIVVTADKFFIPSGVEVMGVCDAKETPGQGEIYEFFAQDSSRRYKQPVGYTTNYVWWTRSRVISSTTHFLGMTTSGYLSDFISSRKNSLAITFCL